MNKFEITLCIFAPGLRRDGMAGWHVFILFGANFLAFARNCHGSERVTLGELIGWMNTYSSFTPFDHQSSAVDIGLDQLHIDTILCHDRWSYNLACDSKFLGRLLRAMPTLFSKVDVSKISPYFLQYVNIADMDAMAFRSMPDSIWDCYFRFRNMLGTLPLTEIHSKGSGLSRKLSITMLNMPNKAGFFPFTFNRGGRFNIYEALKLTELSYDFRIEHDDFMLWLMARQMDLYWHSLPKHHKNLEYSVYLNVALSENHSPQHYVDSHPFELNPKWLTIIFVPGVRIKESVRLNAWFDADDWISKLLSFCLGISSIGYLADNVKFYSEISTSDRAIYRMILYVGMLNSDICWNDSLVLLMRAFSHEACGNEMSSTEMEFLFDLCIQAGHVSFLFDIFESSPNSALARHLYILMRQHTRLDEMISSSVPASRILYFLTPHAYNFDSFNDQNLDACKVEACYHDRLVQIGATCRDGIASHFLIDTENVPILRKCSENCFVSGFGLYRFNGHQEFAGHRFFQLPYLEEDILQARLSHFHINISEPDGGEASWHAAHVGVEYEMFERDLKIFVERMFSVLGWLVYAFEHEVTILYDGSGSTGAGLYLASLSTMAEVIFLPSIGLFRHDTKGAGFMPCPFLYPVYLALMAELHGRLIENGMTFPWSIHPAYMKFLYYGEDVSVHMDETAKQIYSRDFKALADLAGIEDISLTYPSLFKVHVPVALEYHVSKKVCLFSFNSPANDKCTHEGLSEAYERAHVPTAPEQLRAYTAKLAAAISQSLRQQRNAYMYHFLRRIDCHFWRQLDSKFVSWYARQVDCAPISLESILAGVTVVSREDWLIFSELDDAGRPILLTAEAGLKTILRSFDSDQLARFFQLTTSQRRVPTQNLKPGSILVIASYPPSPFLLHRESSTVPDGITEETSLQSRNLAKSIPLPVFHNCFKTINWTLFSTLEENRLAFSRAIVEHYFTIDEYSLDDGYF